MPVTRLRTRRDASDRATLEAVRGMLEGVAGAAGLVAHVERELAATRGWRFVMVDPVAYADIIAHLRRHSRRPLVAMELFTRLFSYLPPDGNEVQADRDELARVAGCTPNNVTDVWLIPLSPTCYLVLERDRRDGAMTDFPRSLPEFERRFPDEAACAEWLLERRWGRGFACPGCGHGECWRLGRKVLTLQCRACRRETSVTAGTVMHRSHLPLKVWFTVAWLVATHRNGMSARQLWFQLGLGSYKSAWLLLRKLRRAMVDPERDPLAGLVEVDETSIPFRAGGEPARPGRSHEGRLLLAGAVEIKGKGPGRTRLAVIGDYTTVALGAFVAGNVAGSTVVSDGWSGYATLTDVEHDPT